MNINLLTDQYFGISQSIWEECCHNTEEILYEEEIGQHIVGLYPYIPRIYGMEDAPTSLLCLYIDSSESFIDPFHKTYIECPVYLNGGYTSTVKFINLFKWIQKLEKEITEEHLIPCFYDSFFQDENIDHLVAIIQQYILENKHLIFVNSKFKDKLSELLSLDLNILVPAERKTILLEDISKATMNYFRHLV